MASPATISDFEGLTPSSPDGWLALLDALGLADTLGLVGALADSVDGAEGWLDAGGAALVSAPPHPVRARVAAAARAYVSRRFI